MKMRTVGFIQYKKGYEIKAYDHVFHNTSNNNPLLADRDMKHYYYVIQESENGPLKFVSMADGVVDNSINISLFDDTWWVLPTSVFDKK